MIKTNKNDYFYAGDFNSSLTGVGVRTNNTTVSYGQLIDGELNGFGFQSHIDGRFLFGELRIGNTPKILLTYINNKYTFEITNGYRPIGIRGFLNETNFGIIDEDDARAIWYRFDDETLHIRDDNYEEKIYHVPGLTNINEIRKIMKINHIPTYFQDNKSVDAGDYYVVVNGKENCYLIKKDDYHMLGVYDHTIGDYKDFFYFVSPSGTIYQERTSTGINTGLSIIINNNKIDITYLNNDKNDGPEFYFANNDKEKFVMYINRNGVRQLTMALMDDFSVVIYDKNKTIAKYPL